MKERTITNYIVRKYSGEDIWNYMFHDIPLKRLKVEVEGEEVEEPVSSMVIDELIDDDERYVQLSEYKAGYYFTSKGRMLKPNERYWAHPSYASESKGVRTPNGYSMPNAKNFTISKGLKEHFNITDKSEVLKIRQALISMWYDKEYWDKVRRGEEENKD